MAINSASKYLNYALLQLASESLFRLGEPGQIPVGATGGGDSMDRDSLKKGNNRASKFTDSSADRFLRDWAVVQHKANTATGFSGTLFKAKTANADLGIQVGDLVLSFRSTEFADDAVRDNQATNVLEVRETGFALGQIADMEKWYAELRSGDSPEIADTARLRVTGYSLGGHLATAFNLLREEEKKASYLPIPTPLETFTFNGAGVGKVKDTRTLTEALATFTSTLSSGYVFKDPLVASRYQELKQKYTGRTSFLSKEETEADVTYVKLLVGSLQANTPRASIESEANALIAAIERIKAISDEALRISGYVSGGDSPDVADIGAAKIAQLDLDYQLAVGKARALIEPGDTGLGALLRDRVSGGVGSIYDVFGAIPPSAVANSQNHYGIPVPVFIEDQPLFRGSVRSQAGSESLKAGEVKLLVNQFGLNDFGDTHSLVLIVDSLIVQEALIQLDSSVDQNTLTQILYAASNKKAESSGDNQNQGTSEGDVLENVVNALGQMLGTIGPAEKLQGKTAGNTWWIQDDRQRLHRAVANIVESPAFSSLKGNVILSDVVKSKDVARSDFGAFIALLNLAPFALLAKNDVQAANDSWKSIEGLKDIFSQWKSDLSLSDVARDSSLANFSDSWIKSRLGMLSALNARNKFNIADSGYLNADQAFIGTGIDKSNSHSIFRDEQENLKIRIGVGPDDSNDRKQIWFGKDEGGSLTGKNRDDSLYGRGGDDILTGGQGVDHLEGGKGFDQYKFTSGDGKDTIIDIDGKGGLYINGRQPFLRGVKNPNDKAGQTWVDEDAGLEFVFKPVSGKVGTLEIRQYNKSTASLGKTDSITIKGFDLGKAGFSKENSDPTKNYLNIRLATDKTLQITPDTKKYIPQDPMGTPVPDATATMSEGGSTTVNVSLNSPIEAEQKLRFKLSGELTSLGTDWKLLVNGTPTAFNQGELTIDAPAGRSQLMFQLLSGNKQTQDTTGKIEVTLLEKDGTPATNDGTTPVQGKMNVILLNGEDNDQVEFAKEHIGTQARDWLVGDAGESELFDGREENDKIEARDGNDLIVNAGMDHDMALGGEGNDRLLAGNLVPLNWTDLASLREDQNADIAVSAFLDGGEGNDRLLGEGGNDLLAGGAGEDLMVGGGGNDLMVGDNLSADLNSDYWGFQGEAWQSLGNGQPVVHDLFGLNWDLANAANGSADIIHGGAGNDYLFGEGGNDSLFAGSGDDVVAGGQGNDSLIGGTGADYLAGDDDIRGGPAIQTGDDTLDGGDGNDLLRGNRGNDALYGGAGDDILNGDDAKWNDGAGEDYLDGGDGNDLLIGGAKDDRLFGGAGNDELVGDANAADVAGQYHGNDYLDGEDGDDKLTGGGGDDRLFGGLGNDLLVGDDTDRKLAGDKHGDDYLDGEGGADQLIGLGGSDRLFGGADNDVIQGDADLSVLTAEFHADDEIDGEAGDDTIFGQGGNDLILGGDGDDILDGDDAVAEGTEAPANFYGNDTLHGGAGKDTLLGRGGDDELTGDEGDDTLDGGDGNDTLDGGEGDDALVGGEGDDYLDGGAGINSIQGDAGNDTIVVGGDGGVYLGGAGDDTYYVSSADAMSFISDEEGENRVVLFDEENPDGVELSTVHVRINRNGPKITGEYSLTAGQLEGAKQSLAVINGGRQVLFENAFLQGKTQLATAGGEVSLGSKIATQVTDNVRLTASEANDFAVTGKGDDAVYGGLGDDEVESNAGNDYLDGEEGDDTLRGGEGNDVLYGGEGNDTLIAGAGLDAMDGGEGDDTFVLNRGDGGKYISDWRGNNRILFGEGITLSDLKIERYMLDGSLMTWIQYGDSGDQVSIAEFQDADDSLTFEFHDGSSVTREFLLEGRRIEIESNDDLIQGTADKDVIRAGTFDNRIFGAEGDDRIYGGGGQDYVEGNDGNDFILLGEGRSSAYGGEGNDELVGSEGSQVLSGDAGDDTLDGGAGDDTLIGGLGNDRLIAGSGNDVMQGGEGNDIYIVGRGDGVDVIEDESGANVIRFSDEAAAAGLFRQVRGDDLFVSTFAGTGVLIKNYVAANWRFERQSDGQALNPAEAITGAEGTDINVLLERNRRAMREAFDGYYESIGARHINGGFETRTSIGTSTTTEKILWKEQLLQASSGGEFSPETGKTQRSSFTTTREMVEVKTVFTGSASAPLPPPPDNNKQVITITETVWQPVPAGNGGSGAPSYGSAARWRYLPVGQTSRTVTVNVNSGGSGPAGGSSAGSGFSTPSGGLTKSYQSISTTKVYRQEDTTSEWLYTEMYGHETEGTSLYLNDGGAMFGGSGDDELYADGGYDSGFYDPYETAGPFYRSSPNYPLTYTILSGGGGNDWMVANGGGDTFIGGDGNDTMLGGYGKDVYIFNAGESGFDIILDSKAPIDFIDKRVWSEYWDINRDEFNFRDLKPASNINIDTTVNRLDREDTIRLGAGIQLGDLSKERGMTDDSGEDDFFWNRRYVDLHIGANQTVRVFEALDYDASLRTEERRDILAYPYESDGDWGTWTDNGHIPGAPKAKVGEEVHLVDLNESRFVGVEWVEFADGSRRKFSNLIASLPVWSGSTNQAPDLVGSIGAKTVKAGSSLDFFFGEEVFTDDGGFNGLAFSATLLNGDPLPDWLTLQNSRFVGQPPRGVTGTFDFRLTATDAAGLSTSTVFSIEVQPPENAAPVIAHQMDNLGVWEDDPLVWTIPDDAFSDLDESAENLTLSVSLDNSDPLPAWLTYDAQTKTFTATADNAAVGQHFVKVTATDSGGLSTSQTFSVLVLNTNDGPTVSMGIADAEATEGVSFQIALPPDAFSDEDAGDALSYSVTLDDGSPLPEWLQFDAQSRTLVGVGDDAQVGQHRIKVTATDGAGASVSTSFTLNMRNVNEGPMLEGALADVTIDQNSTVNLQLPEGLFSDPDAGDTLVYTVTLANGDPAPGWLSFDPVTRTLSGMAGNDAVGVLDLRVVATDRGNLSASTTFRLTVQNVNDGPVAAADAVVADAGGAVGNMVTDLLANDTDPDSGDTLSIRAVSGAGQYGQLAIEGGGESAVTSITYQAGGEAFEALAAGETADEVFTYTVRDSSGAESTAEVHVTVTGVNDGPVLAGSIEDVTTRRGSLFSFVVPQGVFSDKDNGDVLTYSAVLASGDALPTWLSFNQSTGRFSGRPGAGDVGALDLLVTATDTAGASVSTGFKLTVNNINSAPEVVGAVDDFAHFEDEALNFVLPEGIFADADGEALNYSVTLSSGEPLPSWLIFDATTRTLSGTPQNADVGPLSLRIIASDAEGEAAATDFVLTVVNTNDAPIVFSPLADRLVRAGEQGAWALPAASIVDVDGDALTYSASGANGSALPDWIQIDAASGAISAAPPESIRGEFVIKLTATDTSGAAVTDEFVITVVPPQGLTLTGNNRSNTLRGGWGDDTIDGGAGGDSLYGEGGNDRLLGSRGADMIDGGEGDDVGLGGAGFDSLFGRAGDDYLNGEDGLDTVDGGVGNDLLEGGLGADTLLGGEGNNLLNGQGGADRLLAAGSNDILIGGLGRDELTTGNGNDVIAFNRGDGADTIHLQGGGTDTLSIGGDVDLNSLRFQRQGDDLKLLMGDGDSILFDDYYAAGASRSLVNLQIVRGAEAAFDAANPLRDNRVEVFDFNQLVARFDAAQAARPNLNRWQLMDALLDAHSGGSDDAAYGGDLAYRYGVDGTLAGISADPAQALLANNQLNSQMQTLKPVAELKTGGQTLT